MRNDKLINFIIIPQKDFKHHYKQLNNLPIYTYKLQY